MSYLAPRIDRPERGTTSFASDHLHRFCIETSESNTTSLHSESISCMACFTHDLRERHRLILWAAPGIGGPDPKPPFPPLLASQVCSGCLRHEQNPLRQRALEERWFNSRAFTLERLLCCCRSLLPPKQRFLVVIIDFGQERWCAARRAC